MTSTREAILAACKQAAEEIGKENLKGLSWFYKNNVPVVSRAPLKKAA